MLHPVYKVRISQESRGRNTTWLKLSNGMEDKIDNEEENSIWRSMGKAKKSKERQGCSV